MSETTMFEETVRRLVPELNKSPTFAMSLGAKELFHTNFLAFLLETDLEPIKGITKSLKKWLFGKDFQGDVWAFRECKNMDLMVVPQDPSSDAAWSMVVIEAKLKSIPTISQLEGYDRKLFGSKEENKKIHRFSIGSVDSAKYDFVRLSGGEIVDYRQSNSERKEGQHHKWDSSKPKKIKRIILAPTDPYKTSSSQLESPRWTHWTWSEIYNLIRIELEIVDRDSDGIVSLVESYSKDLCKILELLDRTEELVGEFCSSKLRIDFQSFDDLLLNELKVARIHDLISKCAYWHLSEKIRTYLETKGHRLEFGVHFSRGTPILEISKKLGSHEIGVQIQGGQYRHFILSRKPDEHLKKIAAARLGWFCLISSEIRDVSELNKFDDNKFLYSKKDMSSFNFEMLCEALLESFDRCPKVLQRAI